MLLWTGTSRSPFLTMNRMTRPTRARNQWFFYRMEFRFPPDGNRRAGLAITLPSLTPGCTTEVLAGFMYRNPMPRVPGYIVTHSVGYGRIQTYFHTFFDTVLQGGCIWIRVTVHYDIMITQYPSGWLLSEIKSFRVFGIL